MSVLDKNIEPDIAYSEVYAQGSVYFTFSKIETERSSETPFIRDVMEYNETRQLDLPILGLINEIPIESMIAQGIAGLFNTDCVVVQRATPMWPEPNQTIEKFVVTIGSGQYQTHPVSSCKVVLRRRYQDQPKPSPST